MKRARRWPPPARPSSPESSRFAPAPPAPAAIIWSPDSTKPAATTPRCWRCPARCRAHCAAPTTSRPPSRTCCFATSRSTPRPSRPRRRRPASFIRPCPGVAHLTLPQDVLSAKAEDTVSSLATLKPHSEFAAAEGDIARIVERIDRAGSVVIMCGAGCRGTADSLRALSDRLRAPLVHTLRGKELMAYDDPRWMGGLGMIGTKAVYHAVQNCDLLMMVGTDYPYSNFLPAKGSVIQIDERPQVLGRRAPTALGVTGSAGPTPKRLRERVSAKTDTRFWDKVTNERRKWDEMLDKQCDLKRSKDRIHPQAVARAVSDAARRDAIFVLDTGLNTLWSGNWIRQTGSQRIIGSFNNAAVGTALGQANGVQVLDRSRQVIALTGDGGVHKLDGGIINPGQPPPAGQGLLFHKSARRAHT